MKDIVIITPDRRGFWHCDYWDRSEYESEEQWELAHAAPDDFLTTSDRASQSDAVNIAIKTWPDAIIEVPSDPEEE